MVKWTTEQEQVIKLRNRNILVSAAAGSGKTAVLVERIIKRITDPVNPVDIDKLLVVTFTKAAAAEMRERIGNAIEKCLEEAPEDENLRRQQTLIHNAQITTIDSFCLFVVRNHFEEIDLDPNFRIADAGELKLLEKDVLDEVFEAAYEEARPKFLQLADAYSDKRSNKAIKEMVAKLFAQSASNPWPKQWISSLTAPYQVESVEALLRTELMQGIFCYIKAELLDMKEQLIALLAMTEGDNAPAAYGKTLEGDLLLFEGLEEIEDYRSLETFCKNIEFKTLASLRNYTGDVMKKEAVKAGRDEIKKEVKELKERYFAMSLEELKEQLKRMEPVAKELVRLSLSYLAAMEEKKKEKHILDFSDIEHAALHIFVDEETRKLRATAEDFQEQFEEIMIDEYQDSNEVQEAIMQAISRESKGQNNLFMVGDVKQSIYRFRLARPELFMEKFNSYDLTESKKQRIDLHKNFRSRAEVLDFTNDIFYKIMAMDLGNVAYDEEAALYVGAGYPENPAMKAEVLLYEKETDEEAGEDSYSNRQLEAHMIANRIKELKQDLQITDKASGKLRPVRNSDIVILLRSLMGWGNDFVSVLEAHDIPAHVATSTGYFSAVEVQTVLSFLKLLDNPYQDIPMAAVLKSAIGGFDNEELAELSLKPEAGGFAEAVLSRMKELIKPEAVGEEAVGDNGITTDMRQENEAIEAALDEKLRHFGKLYFGLRSKVADTPIHQLITQVLEQSGYGDYVKALPAGAKRSANLDMLVEKAISYEKTSYKGLFHFVRYIDQLQKYQVDFGEADVTGENEDVVRIMTIHKSKGLEFPVVFVSGIAKRFNDRDTKEKLSIHPDMGLGLDEITVSPRTKRRCLVRTEIADRIRRDNLGEELRVLYVALTRAKEKLILTGMVKNEEQLYKNYTGNILPKKPLSFRQRAKAKSYLDWIVPAVLSYPDRYGFDFKDATKLVLAEAERLAELTLAKEELREKIQKADVKIQESLLESFDFKYPYLQEMDKKIKYSVSELKKASMVENYDRLEEGIEVPEFLLAEKESYVPDFMRQSVSTEEVEEGSVPTRNLPQNRAALRGTAVHRVLAAFDFKKLLDIDTGNGQAMWKLLEEEIGRMLSHKLLTEELEKLIYRKDIIRFLQSETADRMAKADRRGELFHEKPFVMDYEGVLLQGIIDAFWLEEGRIVLLDYKTDRVSRGAELFARYETQLKLYAKALSRIFAIEKGKEPESLIYSFALDEIIDCK